MIQDDDIVSRLEHLGALWKYGTLTQEEFAGKKGCDELPIPALGGRKGDQQISKVGCS